MLLLDFSIYIKNLCIVAISFCLLLSTICRVYYVYFRTKAETKKEKRNRIKKIVFLHEKTKVKTDILDAKGHCYRFNYYLHTIHSRFTPKC